MNNNTKLSVKEPIQVIVQTGNGESKDKTSLPMWLDLIKWFFGTLVIGFLGIYTNYKIQETQLGSDLISKERELGLKQMEIDANLIEAVSEKYTADKNSQLSYLIYIQPFITTDSLQYAIQKQITVLGNELNSNISNSLDQQTSKQLANLSPEKQEELKKEAAAEEQKRLAADGKTSLEPMPSVNESPFDKSFDPSFVGNAIKSIEESKSLSTPNVQYNYVLIGSPETQWCKAGYFIVFNNVLRIGVRELNKNVAIVNLNLVKNTDLNSIEKNIKDGVTLVTGEFIEINEGDFRYKISLDYIGAGGKNPFTRAAYITVATYLRKNATAITDEK